MIRTHAPLEERGHKVRIKRLIEKVTRAVEHRRVGHVVVRPHRRTHIGCQPVARLRLGPAGIERCVVAPPLCPHTPAVGVVARRDVVIERGVAAQEARHTQLVVECDLVGTLRGAMERVVDHAFEIDKGAHLAHGDRRP